MWKTCGKVCLFVFFLAVDNLQFVIKNYFKLLERCSMKKLLLTAGILLTVCIAIAYSLIQDYNANGWVSSNGLDYMPGQAYNVRVIPGGYSFYCEGAGDCYLISGPNLYIWDNGIGFGNPSIDIWRN